ncbi:MAG: heavy metal-associated domain-containing protein [Oscillospiraceae bacterium]|nr:heavy metal-associated domain-containing protein [Oscillospiraceae bacterium]
MAVLKVEGMHCEKCVERINKALSAAELDFSVSLEDKTVTVNGCEHCVAAAVEALDDLGFEAVQE